MKIIDGNNLKSILNSSNFILDSAIKQFIKKRFPRGTGSYMLLMDFKAPQNLIGISNSSSVIKTDWVLIREVKKESLLGLRKINYFEFEIIDGEGSKKKIYIPTKSFIRILEELSRMYDNMSIEFLADTIGLKDNEAIKEKYLSQLKREKEKLGITQPRDYYDKKFGSKTDLEKQLARDAKEAISEGGTFSDGSRNAYNIYSEIIKINPENAYALFNRGLSVVNFWKYEKIDLHSEKVDNDRITELRNERIKMANEDFNKAIELNPYLQFDYKKLQKMGRVID